MKWWEKPLRPACVEDVDRGNFRKMNLEVWDGLVSCRWLQLRQNVLVVGPSAIGKTYVASALSRKALCEGHSVLCTSGLQLCQGLYNLFNLRLRRKLITQLARTELLVIDDFTPACLAGPYEPIVFQLFEERHSSSTLVITSVPAQVWYECMTPRIGSRIEVFLQDAHVLTLARQPCVH
jgi:DNA replication protein DnaC